MREKEEDFKIFIYCFLRNMGKIFSNFFSNVKNERERQFYEL